MLEEAVRALLLQDPAVSQLVATRIYPRRLPSGAALPALTYFRTASLDFQTHQGRTGLTRARINVGCWVSDGSDPLSAHNLARQLSTAVRKALVGFRGVAGGVTIGSISEEDVENAPDEDISSDVWQVPVKLIVLGAE